MRGRVFAHHDSHGLSYEVKHPDGSIGHYDPCELEVVAPADTKAFTDEEIRTLWPQAAAELRGFQRHLEAKSGITASQLGMALQLAEAQFKTLSGK